MSLLFFFNDTATTEIYTLSLHDALPISVGGLLAAYADGLDTAAALKKVCGVRSEEHTSELQSLRQLVCRLLLEKKNRMQNRSKAEVADLGAPIECPITHEHDQRSG